MKNYQKLHYRQYYAQNSNGEWNSVTREVCFAPGNPTTAETPRKQRWYYDPEAGFAVRLAQTPNGDAIGRRNAADLKAEERMQAKEYQCLWKHTDGCMQDCDYCTRKQISRTVELDRSWANDSSPELMSIYEIVDETVDVLEEVIR